MTTPHNTAQDPRCDYCGSLGWTVEKYGRLTHKEACPHRTDPWSQSYPQRGPDDRRAEGSRGAE